MAVLMALTGCSGGRDKASISASTMAPANVLEVDALGRKFTSTQPAQLRASMGSTSLLDFWFQVADGQGVISVNGRLRSADVGADVVTLSLSNGPTADGVVSVQPANIANVPDLGSGTLRLTMSPAAINGEVEISANGSAWPLSGKLLVSCWVPSAMLPNAQPSGGTSSSTALIDDAEFVSAPCVPFAKWAGRQ